MGALSGQDPVIVLKGDTVRVEYQCADDVQKMQKTIVEGSVISFRENLLHVNKLGSEVHELIPWECTQRWWTGRTEIVKKLNSSDFIIDGIVGAAVGAGIGSALGATKEFCPLVPDCGGSAQAIGTLVGASLGYVAGGMIGALFNTRSSELKWSAQKNRRIQFEVGIQDGMVGISMTFTWNK